MSPAPFVFGACGLVLIGVSVPLALRKVPPNRLLGFRTPATLQDERLWYEVNAKTGVDLVVVGLGLIGLAVANLEGALGEGELLLSSLMWMSVGTLATVVHGGMLISRTKGKG